MLPHLNPNEEDRRIMIHLAIYIMGGLLIAGGLLWLLGVTCMAFNAVVDWFMR